MKFHHLLRTTTFATASLLLIMGAAALCPIRAGTSQGESEAERYVREQIKKGEVAYLGGQFPEHEFPADKFPHKRKLSAAFIASLLTRRDQRREMHPQKIGIQGATITGDLNLVSQEVPYDVYLEECTFEGVVDFTDSYFAKGLEIRNSIFEKGVFFSAGHFTKNLDLSLSVFKDDADFSNATVGFDFIAENCTFTSEHGSFQGMKVGRDFRISPSAFDNTWETTFQNTRVGGAFSADSSRFRARHVRFDELQVDGSFSVRECEFHFDADRFKKERPSWLITESTVTFTGARFGDLFLNDSTFDNFSTIDFTRMQAELISFDDVKVKTLSEIKVEQMAFKRLSPVDPEKVKFLLSPYNAEFYTALETSWRTQGYPEEADTIFIAKRRAQQGEMCKNFWHRCDRGAWALSLFEDALAGYGKRLQNLLYWSLGFLVIGVFVFRSEKGMRLKDTKGAEHYEGRYHAFWYSLDLFLPIIKLGEADVWTPKDDRRWANLYRKVHIIIGSLFVPIGLAAWTGIIK